MRKKSGNRIVAMMPVKNESGRYLSQVLEHLSLWVDKIVVIDDASEDDTYEVVKSFDKVIAYRNERPLFIENEAALRSKLWDLTVEQNPDWIVALDADEMFEDRIIDEAEFLINQDYYDAVYFRVFDFWASNTHYRIDGGWNPWVKFQLFLVRYNPNLSYTWPQREIHCGRFPSPCQDFIPYYSDIRLKHFGWADEKEHYKKYLFYREKDLKLHGKVLPHTQSIMISPKLNDLEEWRDSKRLYFLKEGKGGSLDGEESRDIDH
ncbi:glycosyltransferase family 2 protein [Thermovorax subterraneus]|nr:glycosyltransferase family 2 protein [Thermovorax subterraneus]